jgi:transposase
MSIYQVAKITGMLYHTVRYIIKRFIKDGHKMINHYLTRHESTWKRKISPDLVSYLTKTETL